MPSSETVVVPMRPAGIQQAQKRTDMTEEYVVESTYTQGLQRVLSTTGDDVEIEISLETYDRMEKDSAIFKSNRILVTNALSDEMQLAPGATEEEVGPEEYQVYVEVMELCQRAVDGLDRPYRETLEQQLGNAIKYGHGLGEITYEHREDGSSTKPKEDKAQPKTRVGAFWARMRERFSAAEEEPKDPSIKRPQLRNKTVRLMPKSIKVKPRGAAKFVVDDFMNVLGLAPKVTKGNKLRYDEIIDRDKFSVLTLLKKDEDPRGRSMYRTAFNWYNLKTQLPSEMLRFILEEVVPKAVATLGPDAAPYEIERDADGVAQFEADGITPKMVTAVESMKSTIRNFRGGSGAVMPHGATLEPFKKGLTGANDGNLFSQVVKLLNNEIENGILLQTLAQSEGEHQARSASQQVAELLHNLVFWIRWLLAVMTVTDLMEVVIEKNLGRWALRYMPFVSFGDFVRRDWATDLEVIARAYFWGFIDDSQRAELMAWLNLPKAGPSRQELGLEATAQADVNGDPIVPNKQRPDKQAGTKDRNKGNGTEKKNGNKQNADIGFSPLDVLGHHRGRTTGFKRNILSGRR